MHETCLYREYRAVDDHVFTAGSHIGPRRLAAVEILGLPGVDSRGRRAD